VSNSRNYNEEAKNSTKSLVTVPAVQHPLKPLVENVVTESKASGKSSRSSSTKSFGGDPLSDGTLDPLSKMVADVSFKEKVLNKKIFYVV
jgi:hypothetical protein